MTIVAKFTTIDISLAIDKKFVWTSQTRDTEIIALINIAGVQFNHGDAARTHTYRFVHTINCRGWKALAIPAMEKSLRFQAPAESTTRYPTGGDGNKIGYSNQLVFKPMTSRIMGVQLPLQIGYTMGHAWDIPA